MDYLNKTCILYGLKRLCILTIVLFLAHGMNSQDLVINEIMSANNNVVQDDHGDYSDWIEIYNPSLQNIDISGWCLTDDPTELTKWSFPSLIIEPESFILIFASGKDTVTAQHIHTNFKIKSEGETLILCDSFGNIIDQTEAMELGFNNSYGRLTDASEQFEIFYTSSPGLSNNNNIALNHLLISHQAGFYSDSIHLKIASSKPEDVIYYTVDGSTPTKESLIYDNFIPLTKCYSTTEDISFIPTTPLEGPQQLSDFIWKPPEENLFKANVIRYRSFSGQSPSSEIVSKSYLIEENIFSRYDLPVISIITDTGNFYNYDTGIYIPGKRFDDLGWSWWPDGNYMNNGDAWERNAHIELFEVNGDVSIAQDCGVRIFGGWSAKQPQKSLRMNAREKYGENKFNYSFFPESEHDEFKNFILRNSGNDFLSTHFRDAFMQSLLSDLDMELQSFSPSIVFINGNYWGLHNIRERYDEHYFERYYNVNEADLTIVNVCGSQEDGYNLEYTEMIDYIGNNSLSIQNNYEYIKTKIDIQNFIDYHISEIYIGNGDWPCNNNKAWKTSDVNSKWRWLIFDLDFGFGFSNDYKYNSLEDALAINSPHYYNCDCSTFLLRNMIKNNEFRQQFINRFEFHLNTTFQKNKIVNRINEFVAMLNNEIPHHIQRWHYPQTYAQWENEVTAMIEFAKYRPCYCAEHIKAVFNLEEINFDCDSIPSVFNNGMKPFKIYPNPGHGIFYMENLGLLQFKTQVTVINSIGQHVADFTYIFNGLETKDVNLLHLETGIYFFIASIKNEIYTKKILIK